MQSLISNTIGSAEGELNDILPPRTNHSKRQYLVYRVQEGGLRESLAQIGGNTGSVIWYLLNLA